MSEFNGAFYKNFFSETLFIVPDKNANDVGPGEGNLETAIPLLYTKSDFKGLVVLLSEPEKEFQEILKNEFLTKILKAIKFNMNEVAFINVTGKPLNLAVLQRTLPFDSVIAFGKKLIDLEHQPAPYTPLKIGERSVIISESLHALGVNTALKANLWNGLQKMFL